MGESAELEQLLKNIQSGLKKYSIKELKDGIYCIKLIQQNFLPRIILILKQNLI
jgi:hypothetical protein